MNLKVYTGPCPAANIDTLLKRTPLRNGKICAVVPDSRSVAVMERRLTEMLDGATTGHSVYTFEGLSKAILSRSANVSETLGNHVRRALLGEIIKSRVGKQSRFYGISGYQGFVSLIGSFLEDIRSSKTGMISHDRDLVSIAGAYEMNLKRLGATDHEGLIRLALAGDMLERFAESFTGPLIVDGFYDLTDIQFELLSGLFKQCSRSVVTLVCGETDSSLFSLPNALKEKYADLGAKFYDTDQSHSDEHSILLPGFLGEVQDGAGHDPDIELHTFRGESSEADWIGGRIRSMLLEGECRPEDIMIVSRITLDSGEPIYTSLKTHGIPIEGGAAQPLINHPLASFVFDIIGAAVNPSEENIAAVLRSRYTGRKPLETDSGRGMYDDRAWSCMISEVDSPEGFVSSLKNIFDRLKVRSNLNGGGDRDTAVRENAVFESLIEILDDFASFYSRFRPMLRNTEFSRLLRLFIGDVTLLEAGTPGQGVLVLDVEHARNTERGIVIVKGFDNSSFPAGHEGYSLHDSDIAAEIGRHKDMEEELLFYMSVAGAKKLILTFPGIDDEGSDSSISPYLKKICDGMMSQTAKFSRIFHNGIPGGAWEDGYVSEIGRKENIIRMLRNSGDSAGSIFESLHSKSPALSGEITHAVNAYVRRIDVRDMNVDADENGEILRSEWGSGRIYSATALERYIGCPVAFFFSDIVGLESERELTDALDALEYGIIIHDALAEFYTSLRDENAKTAFPASETTALKKRMDGIIDAIFYRRREKYLKINPVAHAAEIRFTKKWMHSIIEIEADIFGDSPFEPFLFEASFGSPDIPFELSYGGTSIGLKGRIDRIDISEENGFKYFRVIDYKTGNAPLKKDIIEGRAIQLPLYMKAVNEILLPGHEIESGLYYSLKKAVYDSDSKKLKGCVVLDSNVGEITGTAEKSAVGAAVSIQRGEFPAPEKCSEYCEWRPLCRGSRERRMEDDNAAQ
jgi:ATP-dependent helicase/DNAse subunit B